MLSRSWMRNRYGFSPREAVPGQNSVLGELVDFPTLWPSRWTSWFALFCSPVRLLVCPAQFGRLLWRTLPFANCSRCSSGTASYPDYEGRSSLLGSASRTWKDWQRGLIIVEPETVVSWHRKRFRLFWTSVSRWKRRQGQELVTRFEPSSGRWLPHE